MTERQRHFYTTWVQYFLSTCWITPTCCLLATFSPPTHLRHELFGPIRRWCHAVLLLLRWSFNCSTQSLGHEKILYAPRVCRRKQRTLIHPDWPLSSRDGQHVSTSSCNTKMKPKHHKSHFALTMCSMCRCDEVRYWVPNHQSTCSPSTKLRAGINCQSGHSAPSSQYQIKLKANKSGMNTWTYIRVI